MLFPLETASQVTVGGLHDRKPNQVITSNNKNGEGKINMVNDSELLIKAS